MRAHTHSLSQGYLASKRERMDHILIKHSHTHAPPSRITHTSLTHMHTHTRTRLTTTHTHAQGYLASKRERMDHILGSMDVRVGREVLEAQALARDKAGAGGEAAAPGPQLVGDFCFLVSHTHACTGPPQLVLLQTGHNHTHTHMLSHTHTHTHTRAHAHAHTQEHEGEPMLPILTTSANKGGMSARDTSLTPTMASLDGGRMGGGQRNHP
jgi:hypothetical protein